MEDKKLNRVFDRVKLSQEREDAILADLLRGKKEERPMRNNKKLTAILAIAAAMMLTLCAFAIAISVEPELLSYLNVESGEETLLYNSAVPLDLEETNNGSTLRLRQVLADRGSVKLLMDLTAPEGTVLNEEFYRAGSFWRVFASDGTEINSSWGSNWILMEDEDPADNKITLLMTLTSSSYDVNLLGATLKLQFEDLFRDNTRTELVLQGSWNFTVPLSAEDSGIFYPLDLPVTIDGHTVQLASVYVSPISVIVDLTEGEESLREVEEPLWAAKENGVTLLTDDGARIEMREGEHTMTLNYISQQYDGERGRLWFRPELIIDPGKIQSVELFGYNVQLQ